MKGKGKLYMWLVSSSASIDDSVMKESSLFISGLKQKGEQRAEDMRRLPLSRSLTVELLNMFLFRRSEECSVRYWSVHGVVHRRTSCVRPRRIQRDKLASYCIYIIQHLGGSSRSRVISLDPGINGYYWIVLSQFSKNSRAFSKNSYFYYSPSCKTEITDTDALGRWPDQRVSIDLGMRLNIF